MQIRCDHCQAAYDVDPPAGSAAALVEMMFRCTDCGRTFPICFGEPDVATAAPAEASTKAEEPAGLLLKQDGKVYHVQDMAKLQRWIAERRVLGTDEVSRAGGEWQQVNKIDELSVFFTLLDQADQLDSPQPLPAEALSEPPAQPEDIAEPEVREVSLPAVELNLVPEIPPHDDLAMEGIPDESELAEGPVELLGPDDPTMDLGEDVGDFFSEEVPRPDDGSIFDAHTEEYNPDEDPDFVWARHRRRQTFIWWGALFVLGTGIGWFVFDQLNKQDAAKTTTVTISPSSKAKTEPTPKKSDPAPASDDAEPTQALAEAQAEPEAPEGAPSVEAEPARTEALEAPEATEATEVIQEPIKPAKEDKKDKPSGRAENKKGWAAVDGKRWAQAKKHFETALSARGGTEARFGLAYVIEHQGQTARATGMYCKISKTGRGEFQREAEGRLRKLRQTCP